MVMAARALPLTGESDFLCKLSVCWSRLRPNTKPDKNSNNYFRIYTLTPLIRGFISVTVQFSNDQSHTSRIRPTLYFAMLLGMISARTIHLVGHNIRIQHCSLLPIMCCNFAPRLCEYSTNLVFSCVVSCSLKRMDL